MPTKLRIAIMSDLHAAPKGGDAASGEVKLFSDDAGSANTAHPMKGLHALIKSNGLRADFVLCPGDMTNKASSTALNYVWAGLHEVRDLMCAKSVLATVGNHDVDSRGHADDAFPREALMKLEPPFPAGDEHLPIGTGHMAITFRILILELRDLYASWFSTLAGYMRHGMSCIVVCLLPTHWNGLKRS